VTGKSVANQRETRGIATGTRTRLRAMHCAVRTLRVERDITNRMRAPDRSYRTNLRCTAFSLPRIMGRQMAALINGSGSRQSSGMRQHGTAHAALPRRYPACRVHMQCCSNICIYRTGDALPSHRAPLRRLPRHSLMTPRACAAFSFAARRTTLRAVTPARLALRSMRLARGNLAYRQ